MENVPSVIPRLVQLLGAPDVKIVVSITYSITDVACNSAFGDPFVLLKSGQYLMGFISLNKIFVKNS